MARPSPYTCVAWPFTAERMWETNAAMSRNNQAFTPEQRRAFARAADPHQWLLTADDLHQQAVALYANRGRGQITLRTRDQAPVSWDETNRATFLLAAFALENAIKAFVVYEHPEFVANGRLARDIRSHKLVELSRLSKAIPYRSRDEWILAAFEDGNESWMRYPCGRDATEVQPQGQMTDRLWNGYRRVTSGYGRKLKTLLRKGWRDPDGEFGSWETTFEWLA